MFMASSQSDHDDDNENRKVSDLAAMFEKYMANAAPRSYRAVSTRDNSVTSKKTSKKKGEDETKDTPTPEGVQSRVPEVLPKPHRTTFQRNDGKVQTRPNPKARNASSKKNEKASNIATTGQRQSIGEVQTRPKPKPQNTSFKNEKASNIASKEHECNAEDQIISCLGDRQNEKYQLNNHQNILGGQVESQVTLPLEEENEILKTGIGRIKREIEVRVCNEIQQLQQTDIKTENEMQRLRVENSNLKCEILRVKQEINDSANEIQKLKQQNSEMTTEISIKDHKLQQKIHEILRSQRERTQILNVMQRLQRNITYMKSQIQRPQNDMGQNLITDSGSVVNLGIELGRGAYGAVFKGTFYETEVAVKEYHEVILSPYNMRNLRREINIASQCRHPNLLQFICATKNDKNRLLIVTELMDTTLRTLLGRHASNRSRLEPQEIKSISLDVARGLNYLHSQKPSPIIHRDISSANVLLWLENNSVKKAKISDYGAANFMGMCNTNNPGAILYAAPEATGPKHGPKIDVYSYGVLLCEMSTCEQPIPEERASQINGISNANVRELARVCTSTDPATRPTMQQIIGCMSTIEM